MTFDVGMNAWFLIALITGLVCLTWYKITEMKCDLQKYFHDMGDES